MAAGRAFKIAPTPISGDVVLPHPMLETFFAAKQHPIPVMIGSNSDEASVLAVFGVDIAGQIQKCAVSGVLAWG